MSSQHPVQRSIPVLDPIEPEDTLAEAWTALCKHRQPAPTDKDANDDE